jgi:hypothetical protein
MPKDGDFLAMAPPQQRRTMPAANDFYLPETSPRIGGIVMARRPAPAAIPG